MNQHGSSKPPEFCASFQKRTSASRSQGVPLGTDLVLLPLRGTDRATYTGNEEEPPRVCPGEHPLCGGQCLFHYWLMVWRKPT